MRRVSGEPGTSGRTARDRRYRPYKWAAINVTLAVGQNWTRPYTFQINDTGLRKVPFLRFKDGDVSSAYRGLHRYVRVTCPGSGLAR